MAFLLPNFTHPGNGADYPNAYARVFSVKKNKAQKVAIVQFEVFTNQAARTALKDPVYMLAVQFMDTPTSPTQYSSLFSAPPVAAASLPAPAVNVDDIDISQTYVGLKTHPATAAILAAATNV